MAVSIAVGVSDELDPVEAFAAAADSAATGLGAPCDLAIVFAAAPHLGHAKTILSEVHSRLAPRSLIGCGAGGVLGGGREMESGPGAAVWALSAPGGEICTHHFEVEPADGGRTLNGLPDPEGLGEALVWVSDRALADGPSILDYLRTVAREYGVDRLIRYRHRVTAASWDSETARWTVEVDRDGEPVQLTASFLWGCSGYYDTEQGYAPEFAGQDDFAGEVVHPQHWPEDLDHAGKQVVVIGSGATAVTLVPAMAEARPSTSRCCSARRRTSCRCRPATPSPSGSRRLPLAAPLPDRALEADPAPAGVLPAGPTAPRPRQAADPLGRPSSSSRPASTSTPTSSRSTTRGTSGSAWSRTATCSGRSASGRASVVTGTIDTFTDAGRPARHGGGARRRPGRHRDRAQPEAVRRRRPASSTARRSTCRTPWRTRR